MSNSTFYRVRLSGKNCGKSCYISGVSSDGCPLRWVRIDDALQYNREEAEAAAQLLADYLCAQSPAGKEVARAVRIDPVTGGITHWRPNLQAGAT